jgi:hypothetical protein
MMARYLTIGRVDAEDALEVEPRPRTGADLAEAAPEDALVLNAGRRLAGALLAGLAAGAGMYLTLAAFALAGGRTALYPFQAVQALMSGRRVLPDYPIPSVRGPQSLDYFFGPLYFLLPALVVAVVAARWVCRRRPADWLPGWRSVLPAALVTTTVAFAVLVLALGFWEASGRQQRTSSGYGVRQLGLVAWTLAHLVYAGLLAGLLGPATRLLATTRRRGYRALRGESPSEGRGVAAGRGLRPPR